MPINGGYAGVDGWKNNDNLAVKLKTPTVNDPSNKPKTDFQKPLVVNPGSPLSRADIPERFRWKPKVEKPKAGFNVPDSQT